MIGTRTSALRPAAALALLGLASVGCPDPEPAAGDELGSESSTEAGGDNLAPSVPTQLSPVDTAADVAPHSQLCWEPSEDPEGQALAYRVWVDEVELANGKTGEYGFASTCTGFLDFADDRIFSWRVRAFEIDAPEIESGDSETWTFQTAWTSGSKPVFTDDFSEERGWAVGGDASAGAWVRGLPQAVYDVDADVAQPGACAGGQDCYFTGENLGGTLGEADVDGGAVVLTSPPFDPGEATSLSVSLARFFYRSDLGPTGLSLEVALLVPDPEAFDGVAVHVLDKLDGGATATAANAWETVAFSACGVELAPGMRLRITAADMVEPESQIVEAAIDDVVVEGYIDGDVCAPGPGALCDPDDPEPACGLDLLCCAEGPVFDGVYRCSHPVPEMGDEPPAEPGGELTGPLGCDAPDLIVVDEELSVYLQNIWVAPDACTLYESCVEGAGWRRVLRFDTKTVNVGSRDLLLGIPANHLDLYTYSPCHEHHHFDDYAAYTLFDGQEVVATGHKQAFCLLDWESWAWPELEPDEGSYTCINQGLTVGWSDTYLGTLDCQWIDVTDVEPGSYTLRMEVNLPPPGKANSTLVERRYDNNVLEIPVEVN